MKKFETRSIESCGVTNTCFTISDEYFDKKSAMNKDDIVNVSNDKFPISTDQKHQTLNMDNSFQFRIQNEKLDKNGNSFGTKCIPSNDQNKYLVSVLDENGKVKITEVEKSDKFEVIAPIYNVQTCTSNCESIHKTDHDPALRSSTINPPKDAWSSKGRVLTQSSDRLLNLQSSTANICESDRESFNNTSDDEDEHEEDITSSTNSEDGVIDTKTNSCKQVQKSVDN